MIKHILAFCALASSALAVGPIGGGNSVTDATLTLSDVTTNNATTSAHGFMPKMDGNSAHFFNGAGTQTNAITYGTTAGTAAPGNDVRFHPFNVKDPTYGATGIAIFVTDAALTNSSTTVTSATANFTSAYVGAKVWGVEGSSHALRLPEGTVTAVNSATSITVSIAATGNYSNIELVVGFDDSDAIRACAAAAKTAKGRVIVPAGGYIIKKLAFDAKYSSLSDSFNVEGAGSSVTVFYLAPSFDFTTVSSGDGIFYRAAQTRDARVSGVTVQGALYTFSGSGYNVISSSGNRDIFRDVRVLDCQGFTSEMSYTGSYGLVEKCHFEGSSFRGFTAGGNSVTLLDTYVGNSSSASLFVTGIAGSNNTGTYFRMIGGIVDESTSNGADINASTDVTFSGTRLFGPTTAGGSGYALKVDGTSNVRLTGCEIIPFGSGNRNGTTVASGGVVSFDNCRLGGSGSPGYALNNSGTAYMDKLSTISSGTINGTLPKLEDNTFIAAGTTTAPTINKLAGSARLAATETTKVVTNSLVTSASKIILIPQTKDSTATAFYPTPASGSFTITANAAATAETEVYWEVRN